MLILSGLVVGRWWAIPVAALIWPGFLMAKHLGSEVQFLFGAAALGATNAAAGVAVHKLAFKLFQVARNRLHAKSTPLESDSKKQL
jgi:hypothetical protein